MKKIEITITPDYLYLRASEAAEKISMSILDQLGFLSSLQCYWKYMREPVFIQKHILTLLEDAPFIGKPLKYWNFFTTRLNIQAAPALVSPKENLSRILATVLNYSRANAIVFDGSEYLPPTLQRVFQNMNLFYENISMEGLGDESMKKSRAHLRSALVNKDLATALAGIYGKHNADKALAALLIEERRVKEGLFYAISCCKTLAAGFSLDEMLVTGRWFVDKTRKTRIEPRHELVKMYADSLFQAGVYKEAFFEYGGLMKQDDDMALKFEAMRKSVRCLERMGDYDRAIRDAGKMLSEISGSYEQAKMKRTLGWCYIRRGGRADLDEAIKISKEAIGVFESLFSSKDKKDLKYNRARTCNNLGAAYELLGGAHHLKTASRYHKKCYKIMHELDSMKWKSGSLLNDSIVCRKLNRLDASLKKASEAIQIRMWMCDSDDLPPMLYNAAFTRICLFFKTDERRYLVKAQENLNTALSFTKEHASKKGVTGLTCLKILCELMLTEEPSAKELFALVQKTGKQNKEEDKVPLLHKVAAVVYLKLDKELPASFNRVDEEKELPAPEEILKKIQ